MPPKIFAACACLLIALPTDAEERTAAKAPSGRFQVIQETEEEKDQAGEIVETIRFRDPALPAVQLAGMPWPGIYHLSPDEQWMVRIQKVGSGDSIAILYHLENNGRVSEVTGFDDFIWFSSDKTSPLKRDDLFHSGVAEATWANDSLVLTLRGTHATKNGDGIVARVIYNLTAHSATSKEAK